MRTLLAALLLVPSLAFGQTTPVKVSLDARGEDVREVLATIFAQAQKPYALDAGIKGKLYVKLDSLPYPKALSIVLTQAGLVGKEKDGVLMISLAPVTSVPTIAPVAKPISVPTEKKAVASKTMAVTPSVYARKVTTRMTKATLSDVFASLSDQAKVPIQVDASVPAYRIDAFFVKTSLKYALGRVCKAAGLHYEAVDGTIKITL